MYVLVPVLRCPSDYRGQRCQTYSIDDVRRIAEGTNKAYFGLLVEMHIGLLFRIEFYSMGMFHFNLQYRMLKIKIR